MTRSCLRTPSLQVWLFRLDSHTCHAARAAGCHEWWPSCTALGTGSRRRSEARPYRSLQMTGSRRTAWCFEQLPQPCLRRQSASQRRAPSCWFYRCLWSQASQIAATALASYLISFLGRWLRTRAWLALSSSLSVSCNATWEFPESLFIKTSISFWPSTFSPLETRSFIILTALAKVNEKVRQADRSPQFIFKDLLELSQTQLLRLLGWLSFGPISWCLSSNSFNAHFCSLILIITDRNI